MIFLTNVIKLFSLSSTTYCCLVSGMIHHTWWHIARGTKSGGSVQTILWMSLAFNHISVHDISHLFFSICRWPRIFHLVNTILCNLSIVPGSPRWLQFCSSVSGLSSSDLRPLLNSAALFLTIKIEGDKFPW